MSNDILIERISKIEEKITPLAESAMSLKELREDIAPRINEAVKAMIVQLADIEDAFQLEDLLYLIKKALRNTRNMNFALEQMENLIEFLRTAEPLLKTAIPQAISFLDTLEQKGIFKIFNIFLEIISEISRTYTIEEIQEIGNGIIKSLGILKKLMSPSAIEFLEKVADIPGRIDLSNTKPIGPFGLMWTLSNKEVRKGLGVSVELLRTLGKINDKGLMETDADY